MHPSCLLGVSVGVSWGAGAVWGFGCRCGLPFPASACPGAGVAVSARVVGDV